MMHTVIESYAWAHTDFLVQITFDRHQLSELIQVPRQMYFMNGIVQHVVQRNILTHVETIVPVLDPLEKFCYSECGQGISHYWITAICVVHGEFPVFYCAIEYLYQKTKRTVGISSASILKRGPRLPGRQRFFYSYCTTPTRKAGRLCNPLVLGFLRP